MTQQSDRLNTALAGRYRIERELGAGGMATVFLAEDLKHKRKVALKVLKSELAALRQEVDALASGQPVDAISGDELDLENEPHAKA